MNISENIQLVTLIFIGIGVIIAIKQLRDQHEWYRREKAMSYSNLYHSELRKTKDILEETFDIVSRIDPIPLDDIKNKIKEDKKLRLELNYLLTYYENVGLACFNKIADEDVLFDLMASTLVSFRKKLINYIDFRRDEAKNPRLWINFELIAIQWENKLNKSKVHKKPYLGTLRKNILG